MRYLAMIVFAVLVTASSANARPGAKDADPCKGAPAGENGLKIDSGAASDDPTELEKRGCFSDDSWPLPLRFEVEPAAQLPPRCSDQKDAYQLGFRESVSGQRYVNTI